MEERKIADSRRKEAGEKLFVSFVTDRRKFTTAKYKLASCKISFSANDGCSLSLFTSNWKRSTFLVAPIWKTLKGRGWESKMFSHIPRGAKMSLMDFYIKSRVELIFIRFSLWKLDFLKFSFRFMQPIMRSLRDIIRDFLIKFRNWSNSREKQLEIASGIGIYWMLESLYLEWLFYARKAWHLEKKKLVSNFQLKVLHSIGECFSFSNPEFGLS